MREPIYSEVPRSRKLIKDTFDNDYRSWTSSETITCASQVKEDWSGESYMYSFIDGKQIDAKQAREYLQGID